MSIERIEITSREQWLALRREDVTASVAGCLLGVHEFITPYELFALKTGLIGEDPEESDAMRRGRLLEPVAEQFLKEERPEWKITSNTPPRVYFRDTAARLGATPDLFVEVPGGPGFGVVQIKSVEPGIFRRKWRDHETGEINPPLWVAVQAIVEAHLAGATWAACAALLVGFKVEIEIVLIPIHGGVIDRLRGAVAEFWEMVGSGKRPDPDWKRDARLIADLYEPTGEIISLEGNNELPGLVDRRTALTRVIADAKDEQAEIKAKVLYAMNGATIAKLPDGRIVTAKRVHRKGYEVQPSEFVDLRVSRSDAA